jgi:hypothetical protein
VLRAVATWWVIAAVAGIGVAAAVDALRGGERTRDQPVQHSRPLAAPKPSDVAAQLREAGLHGTLVHADGGCRLRALRLPDLEPTAVPESAGRPVRSAGTDEPSCEISHTLEPHHPPTFVNRGRVLQLLPCGEALCRRVLLSRRDLARAASYPSSPEGQPFVAREIAWLSGDRLAVVVRGGYPDFIAVFRGRRFLFRAFSGFQPETIQPSPLGGYLAVEDDGFHMLRMGHAPRTVPIPEGLTTVRAVTWSPDELWLALATRASVWLLALEEPGRPLIRLPLEALDVAWRD